MEMVRIRRIIIVSLFKILFLISYEAFGQSGISSKYIEVVMDNSSGRFYISTLVGDPDNPNDDKKRILFEKMPPTTYPSILVNDEGFAVGTDDGYFENRPGLSKNRLVWTWRPKKYDKIKLLQIIEIITNPFTLRDDTVRISYIVVNEDNKEHRVNVRLLLDTTLGEGDVAPFFVPPYGKIDSETVFYEGNMPNIWYSFDSIKDPKVRSMGIVSGIADVSTPSMLVFANWRKLDRDKFKYLPEVGSSLGGGLFGGRDAAVGIYFKEVLLKPQELTLYSTIYGLYGDTLKKFDSFSTSLTTPEEVTKFPFIASVSIENTSGVDVKDLSVEIELNTNYFYVTNNKVFTLTNFKINDTVLFSWDVFGNQGIPSGEYEVKVKVSGFAISTNIYGEVSRKFKFISLATNVQTVDTKELGIKQTNVSTNFFQTNFFVITNYYNYTNYFTNTTYITNLYEYIQIDERQRIKSVIDKLNRELDYLISIYYITTDKEERNRIRERMKFIKEQIEVEKEKLKVILGF